MGVAGRSEEFATWCAVWGVVCCSTMHTVSAPHFGYADELVGVVRDVQLDNHVDGVCPIEEDAHRVHCTSGRGLLEAGRNSGTVNGTVI